jgi:hypothetical protein
MIRHGPPLANGGGLMSLIAERKLIPDALHAHQDGEKRNQKTQAGKQGY